MNGLEDELDDDRKSKIFFRHRFIGSNSRFLKNSSDKIEISQKLIKESATKSHPAALLIQVALYPYQSDKYESTKKNKKILSEENLKFLQKS